MTHAPRLAWLCAILVPVAATGQDLPEKKDRARVLREGTHVFRRILFDYKLRPLDRPEALAEQPGRSLVILLGDLGPLRQIPGGLDDFLRKGGAVLAASDRNLTDQEARQQLRRVTGASVQKEPLVCTMADRCYRGLMYCPYVLPLTGGGVDLFQQPRGGRLNRVAANVPSMLVGTRVQGMRVLAVLPPNCGVESGGLIRLIDGFPAFAVGGEVGAGRVLLLADHSLFINEMMLPSDTHNVEFTYNCLRWLQGEKRQRDRVLFFEEGRIETRFEIPLRSAAIPPEEALRLLFERRNELLVEADRGLARLEEEGWFDNKALDLLDRAGLTPRRLGTLLAVLGTMALLFFLLYRLGIRARFRHETTVPLLAHAVGRNLPVAPLIDQRQHALLASGNVYEPAARLVRTWFVRHGVDVPVGSDPVAPPRFQVAGGWWRARQKRRRLHWLWRLARGLEPIHVGPAELWRLQRELQALDREWTRGQWTLAPEGDSTGG